MAKTIKLKIVTPEKILLEEEVEQVTLPTVEGEITVLPGHVPLISALKSGDIVAKKGDEFVPMAVVGGFIEVKPDEVIILADFAEHIGEISEAEIAKARARAEKLKSEKDKVSREDFEHFATELERSLTRVRISEKWR